MLNQTEISNKIKNCLNQFENIVFALIFGSYNSKRFGTLSDIDIGIYFNNDFDLLTIGKIIAELEKVTNKKIDIVVLNNLYNKSPLLAYKIVDNCQISFSKDDKALINFKRRTFLHYLDTQVLRENVNKAFYKRISSNKFGQSNYA